MESEMQEELTFDDVKNLLDKTYELSYVDYRDSLSESLESIQKAIQEQDICVLDEEIDEWNWENRANSVDYILTELTKEISDTFDIDMEEAENFIEENKDGLEEIIYDKDVSNPLDDLLRNTDDPVFFYDTGLWINEEYDESDLKQSIKDIKKTLKIKGKAYDQKISMMVQQASYGGRLVVYFREDIRKLLDIGNNNTINFKNPMVAIIDTGNGSGDHTDLENHEFSLPLNIGNIFIDKLIKYSYTYDVCGMYSSWCECTSVSFSNNKRVKKVADSNLHNELDREEEYSKTFKSGKCTPLDMDMNRHRHVVYINEFPCGSHCLDCNTFWID